MSQYDVGHFLQNIDTPLPVSKGMIWGTFWEFNVLICHSNLLTRCALVVPYGIMELY